MDGRRRKLVAKATKRRNNDEDVGDLLLGVGEVLWEFSHSKKKKKKKEPRWFAAPRQILSGKACARRRKRKSRQQKKKKKKEWFPPRIHSGSPGWSRTTNRSIWNRTRYPLRHRAWDMQALAKLAPNNNLFIPIFF